MNKKDIPSNNPIQDATQQSIRPQEPNQPVSAIGTESMAANHFTQPAKKGKNHKLLKTWLIISLILLVLSSVLQTLVLIPYAGVYIALGIAPILLVMGLLSVLNLIIVIRSLLKKHITGVYKKIAVLVLILSAMSITGGVSSFFIVTVQYSNNQKTQASQDKSNSYYSEVTYDKAITLLNECKIYQLNYDNSKGSDWWKTPEKTDSGILIYDEYSSYGKPSNSNWDYARDKYVMYIADREIKTIVPVARQAQKTCEIKFRHKDTDEQKKDGHWYFKDTLVN